MQFGSIKLEKSEGSILAHSIKLENLNISKGTLLTENHIMDLRSKGVQSVVVARLENGDIEENKSAIIVSKAFSHNSLIFSKANTGRINIFSKHDGLLIYNVSSLIGFNLIDEGITLALLTQNSFVKKKQLIGTLKVIPYSLPKKTILKFRRFENLIIVKPVKEKKFSLIQTSHKNMKESLYKKTLVETKKRVENLSFEGSGCAISMASTSIMTELVKGKSIEISKKIVIDFLNMIKNTSEIKSTDLDEEQKIRFMSLSGVKQYPMRVKCATLAWHTLISAMEGKKKEVNTETVD